MDLTLTTRQVSETTVLSLQGELDMHTSPRLRDEIVKLTATREADLVIDLSEVDFLDSTALGVLVGGLRRVRTFNGSLMLVCTRESMLRVFRITGLSKVFYIYDSVEAALADTRSTKAATPDLV